MTSTMFPAWSLDTRTGISLRDIWVVPGPLVSASHYSAWFVLELTSGGVPHPALAGLTVDAGAASPRVHGFVSVYSAVHGPGTSVSR